MVYCYCSDVARGLKLLFDTGAVDYFRLGIAREFGRYTGVGGRLLEVCIPTLWIVLWLEILGDPVEWLRGVSSMELSRLRGSSQEGFPALVAPLTRFSVMICLSSFGHE